MMTNEGHDSDEHVIIHLKKIRIYYSIPIFSLITTEVELTAEETNTYTEERLTAASWGNGNIIVNGT